MTLQEVDGLVGGYLRWLKDKTVLKQLSDDWVEITTPHIDRHNDFLQIYVRKEDGGFLLTDDGYIINDLAIGGCELVSSKRQEMLRMTLAGFGVSMGEGDSLFVHATADNFPAKKHSIIQAMLSVNDMFCLASPFTSSLFMEDVLAWLDSANIRYTPNLKFTGKSGYDHRFSFIIPKSSQQPERLLEAVATPKTESAKQLLFKWSDIRDTRARDSRLLALLNDTESKVLPTLLDALRKYEIHPVLWSRRDDALNLLAS
jgi:hypothetical protein